MTERAAAEQLKAEPVRRTVSLLHDRIQARFPTRGLRQACQDLLVLVDEVGDVSLATQSTVRQARFWSRALMVLILAATLVALVLGIHDATVSDERLRTSLDWLPLIETVIADLVYAGVAVFFLYSFPERIRRGRTLALLHQLRSMAHVIDMHQLTKDPEMLRDTFRPTAVSRPLDLTRDEMERYFEYCSEMLSLVGKTAALCAEESRDVVVLDTVSTIESLTVGMSRKIWQKITILNAIH
jgi:hypothetical protein